MKTGCIILAGGKSSRMGEDKALLEYEGKYFIEKIAEELSFFDEKIIARGNNSSLTGITDSDWKIIPDIYPDHGPMGGLHAALKACESDTMFVVTCDMPLITGELAKRICVDMFSRQNIGDCKSDTESEAKSDAVPDAVIAVTTDGKYHPLCGVYKKELYIEMEEYLKQDNNRMMSVLKNNRVKYLELNEESSRQLANVNTREEYEKMICNK